MTEETTTTTSDATQKKSNTGKIILIVVAVLVVLGICCCVGTLVFGRSLMNDSEFKAQYCDQWEEQGHTPEEDPFKLCI